MGAEAQRLFDVLTVTDGESDRASLTTETKPPVRDAITARVPSQGGTGRRSSRPQTRSSRIETTPEPRTGWRLSPTETSEATELLRAVAEAAKLESTARAHLDDAAAAARAAGHSWRELGIASGIPHQTLHRRFRDQRDRPFQRET